MKVPNKAFILLQISYLSIWIDIKSIVWDSSCILIMIVQIFIWETRESGDINVCRNKTLNCYPNYMNGLYSENNLSNTKPNKY